MCNKIGFHDAHRLQDMAHKLRILSIQATEQSNSGHPTTCSSIAEIISVLFFKVMRYKVCDPRDPANDRLILSKGHAAPILYAAWAQTGLLSEQKLMTLRKSDSNLEGHPTPRINFIDVATGSLGHGVSIASGMAYVGKYVDKGNYRVYCIIGDGESAEGSVWEGCSFASHYKLDNLCIILDGNRMGQTGPTALEHNFEVYRKRFTAFGCNTISVDGHDVEALLSAFTEANDHKGSPTIILAKTMKGKHFPSIEDLPNFHGKPIVGSKADEVIKHINSLIKQKDVKIMNMEPTEEIAEITCCHNYLSEPPNYKKSDNIAVRYAYGTALVKLAKTNPRVIAFDADTSNSTYSEKLRFYNPQNYVECYIAEQNMLGVAIGATCRNRVVAFCSSFAAFLTRAYDQIRMGAVSRSSVNICGSHCGVSIGADGPSQMGLEDIAMFRAIPGCVIFYPSDAVSCERAVELAANYPGMTYIRTTRPKTRIIYPNDEKFEIGKAKVLRSRINDQVLIITAGITLHQVLLAHDELVKSSINVRIIDPFTISPLDWKTIICNARAVGGRIVTIEDHYISGGLGDAVLSAVGDEPNAVVTKIAVSELPRSASDMEQLDLHGLSSKQIIHTIRNLLGH